MSAHLHPVILAGGSGTRFWPLSRRKTPKQLLPLASERPLIVDTWNRVRELAEPSKILVVCGASHAAAIAKALPRLPKKNLLIEPEPRNTAAAIGLAATVAKARDPLAVLAVLPSDHAIQDVPAFVATIAIAEAAAAQDALVTIGVKPTRPETGYGYIKVGDRFAKERRAKKVIAFVEKPDLQRAKGYLHSGDYLWNAGMFVFRATRLLDELARHLPACSKVLDAIAPHVDQKGFAAALKKHFPQAPSISIDYAVMEKAGDLAVVPADFGWSDLGSFAAIADVRTPDADGNVTSGDTVLLDAADNLVLAGGKRPVVLIGVEHLVIVDTGDALLVCHRDKAQEVRKAVEALQERGDEHLL